MNLEPMKNYVLRVGVGRAISQISAFDRALIAAGVAGYNLVKVSSILPPNSVYQTKISLLKGSLLPSAFASIYAHQKGEVISAAVAVAIPDDNEDIGVIMEHSARAYKEEVESIVRLMAEDAMATRGIKSNKILSIATECYVESEETCCAFATVCMW